LGVINFSKKSSLCNDSFERGFADRIAIIQVGAEGVTGTGQMSIVPPRLVFGTLIFVGFKGVLGGLYPVTRAARLDLAAH
jgi:hypothetical protein